jgi:hypothetical protein
VDDDGRDLDSPQPSPVSGFAQKNGEGAFPFYEAVVARCQGRFGWAATAFSALAYVGTPRAIVLLEKHAQPGQPDREDALNALLGVPTFASSESLVEHLLNEADADMRRLFAIWLFAHGDARALPGLHEAMQREKDAATSQMIRVAALQIEHPDRCALADNEWRWATLGKAAYVIWISAHL